METATVRRSESIAALAAALATAQGELKNPAKTSSNPHFKSKYADLATVRDVIVPVFSKHGLAIVQVPCEFDGGPALLSLLAHKGGEWIESIFKLRLDKTNSQGVGSALTYARRYALQSIAGVAAEDDDDGQVASQPPSHASRPPTQDWPRNQHVPAKVWSAEGVYQNLRDLHEIDGGSVEELQSRLFRAVGAPDAVCFDDLTADQLKKAGNAVLAKLRSAQKASIGSLPGMHNHENTDAIKG